MHLCTQHKLFFFVVISHVIHATPHQHASISLSTSLFSTNYFSFSSFLFFFLFFSQSLFLLCYNKKRDIKELNGEERKQRKDIEQHLNSYSDQGLRTLLFGARVLSDDEYEAWSVRYRRAAESISNREANIEKAFNEIEKGLTIVGCTAVEDKLQGELNSLGTQHFQQLHLSLSLSLSFFLFFFTLLFFTLHRKKRMKKEKRVEIVLITPD